MDNLTTTLLGLWRLAASHGRLDEVIEEIAAGLGRYVIFERLLILELDQEQARLKSAAQFGMTPAVPGHGLDPLPPFAPLRRWCLGDDLVQGRAEEVRQRSARSGAGELDG
jgi:hypothetical protein